PGGCSLPTRNGRKRRGKHPSSVTTSWRRSASGASESGRATRENPGWASGYGNTMTSECLYTRLVGPLWSVFDYFPYTRARKEKTCKNAPRGATLLVSMIRHAPLGNGHGVT